MSTKDTNFLQSIVEYVNDVKPYHTKFREILSQINFKDTVNVKVSDSTFVEAYFQNVWCKDDLGSYMLSLMSDGTELSKRILLPPAVYPRFSDIAPSVTDREQRGDQQIPVESVIESQNTVVTNIVANGNVVTVTYDLYLKTDTVEAERFLFSDVITTVNGLQSGSIEVWGNTVTIFNVTRDLDVDPNSTYSIEAVYQLLYKYPDRVQVFYLNTHRYAVSFHQGSQIDVDGVRQVFGQHYTIDSTRGFIQFLPEHAPSNESLIHIRLFKSDRIYISCNIPFAPSNRAGYDMQKYEEYPYDYTGDFFYLTVDRSTNEGYILEFFNSDVSAGQKGELKVLSIDQSVPDGTEYLIECIDYWRFSVRRVIPTPGSPQILNFKDHFDNGEISLSLQNTWSEYVIEQDTNSYHDYKMVDFHDEAEFFSDLSIQHQHGYDGDTLHHPVRYKWKFGEPQVITDTDLQGNRGYDIPAFDVAPYDGYLPDLQNDGSNVIGPPSYLFGSVKVVPKKVLIGDREHYLFELDEIPPKWSYVEIRLQQVDQFNPWVNVSFREKFSFFEDVPDPQAIPQVSEW